MSEEPSPKRQRSQDGGALEHAPEPDEHAGAEQQQPPGEADIMAAAALAEAVAAAAAAATAGDDAIAAAGGAALTPEEAAAQELLAAQAAAAAAAGVGAQQLVLTDEMIDQLVAAHPEVADERANPDALAAALAADPELAQRLLAQQGAMQQAMLEQNQALLADPGIQAALASSGLATIDPATGQMMLDPSLITYINGAPVLQLPAEFLAQAGMGLPGHPELYAAAGTGQAIVPSDADSSRQYMEGQRKADYQALTAAKRQGQLATVNFELDLPPELNDVDIEQRSGIVEVPLTGDVLMLKRLFQYQAHNKLLPALQTLVTSEGLEMADLRDDGTPMPLAHYGVANGSTIQLRIHVPDSLEGIPMVDEALASAAYGAGGGGSRTPSRKTRWTTEQIEALIEGVEKYGLSAWRTIVMDPRLSTKNNMQCKDKFRNLCLTIIQGRPERGLTLPWQLKDRVRALIDQENIKGNSWTSMGGSGRNTAD